MLKQAFLNAAFTGMAQLVSLLVVIALAGALEAERFGILSVQLSAAALLSIICTLQFERVYVRVKARALTNYIAFHLRCLFVILLLFFLLSLPISIGPSSVLLAVAIALSQISLYAAARRGRFRSIWLMKAIQATTLLVLSTAIYLMDKFDWYWLAFLGSYLGAGLVVFDKPTRLSLTSSRFRNDVRRFTYSVNIAAMSLGALLSSSFTREFPVLLSGAMGQIETAGALGLVMRTVGAPVGLLARSASAVVANYVATAQFDTRAMGRLLIIPFTGAVYIALLIIASWYLRVFANYNQFSHFLIALSPFFLFRAYVGMLGSALVFHRLQGIDLALNVALAGIAFTVGLVIYFYDTEIIPQLWIVSAFSMGFGIYQVRTLAVRMAKE